MSKFRKDLFQVASSIHRALMGRRCGRRRDVAVIRAGERVSMVGPLDGLNVIDASSGVGGPFCAKLLASLLNNVLASQYALGLTNIERPVPAAGRGGLVCAHCGFASAHDRAFYCPKCGMRLLRG